MKAPQFPAQTPVVLNLEIEEALRAALRRGAAVSVDDLTEIQTLIWDTPPDTNAVQILLHDLATDLEYAGADLGAQSQYTSRLGAERAANLLTEALEAIEEAVRLSEAIGPAYDTMQANPDRGIPAENVFASIRAHHADRSKKT